MMLLFLFVKVSFKRSNLLFIVQILFKKMIDFFRILKNIFFKSFDGVFIFLIDTNFILLFLQKRLQSFNLFSKLLILFFICSNEWLCYIKSFLLHSALGFEIVDVLVLGLYLFDLIFNGGNWSWFIAHLYYNLLTDRTLLFYSFVRMKFFTFYTKRNNYFFHLKIAKKKMVLYFQN